MKNEIPRLLKIAFEAAEAGDEGGAMRAWRKALGLGYFPTPDRTERLEAILDERSPRRIAAAKAANADNAGNV